MKEIELEKDATLKQSNRLVEARYRLTKHEQRIIIAICSQLKKNSDEFEKIHVRVSDMTDFCKIKGNDSYGKVKSVIHKLMTRVLYIQSPDGIWYMTHWLQSAKYLGNGVIEYRIDSSLKTDLLKLKAAYLETPSAPLMEFRRDYSARLYFLLKKMLKVGRIEYDLDFFRDRFMLGKTYEKFSNLKNGVLEPAIEEINEKSDLKVEHEYIKLGRSFQKIAFRVSLKKTYVPMIPEKSSVKKVSKKPPEDEAVAEIIGKMAKRGISEKDTRNLIKKYGLERVENNRKWAVQRKQGKVNIGGWIIDCIKEDRATEDKARERIAAKEEERERKKQEARWKSKDEPIVGADAKREPPNPKIKAGLSKLKENLRKRGGNHD